MRQNFIFMHSFSCFSRMSIRIQELWAGIVFNSCSLVFFASSQDGHSDVYICGMKNRNRALNGDIVVVLLDNQSKWKVSLFT